MALPIGVNLTRNPHQELILHQSTYHQDPRYPTPVLSKAKTSPPRLRGGVRGGVKGLWGKRLNLS
ncbi:hypothetical protein NIES22_23150 [Calothrix brevissima NIES-22]|nr:hypothetical protein NIES22_23150 [Calothrix brevissima NIES-22]